MMTTMLMMTMMTMTMTMMMMMMINDERLSSGGWRGHTASAR
eukprot:SAG25_NODE_3340_length_1123_cov_1.209961_4_plen_42_part_00